MRRKDITYYLNSIKLKIDNRRFLQVRESDDYAKKMELRRQEYSERFNSSVLSFPSFGLSYKTYFYFNSTKIFDEAYSFNNGFPISLKNGNQLPLIPLYFGLVYMNCNLLASDIKLLKGIADYTLSKSVAKGNTLSLPHEFDYKIFGLKAPWNSGITQSIATSFFLRLYVLTNDKKYLIAAENFFQVCCQGKDNGGCLVVTKSGLEWVEEYMSKPSAYVLSGHIFAIIASAELYQITKKEAYKFRTENWLRSLVNEFSSYQYKGHLVHNKFQWKLSNLEYQGLYVGQFLHLYEITGNELFLEFYTFYNSKVNWNRFHAFYGI